MYIYYKHKKKFFPVPVEYEIPKKSSIKIFSFRRNFLILYELIKVISKLDKLRKSTF